MMNQRRLKVAAATTLISLTMLSCASYNAFNKARTAEREKNWDEAVVQYERALEVSPDSRQYKVHYERARREASRVHFEKGKTLRSAMAHATGMEQLRLAQMAATELQLTVKLDSTNQFAVVELSKVLDILHQIQQAAAEQTSLDDIKKRARSSISKAQPPALNPASDEPITLTFSRDTPVKDIYRALGNAFGINIVFDQAVKDDRITIDLHDVTAQAALERVMQAANHFYKILDEKTIIVVPDNPQARRDYEDLVIQTFYLSNGDAEQVTNVVRTMIEARNVFPLKALNAITIRDTADKVRIAEKIIQANDKAKAEVVVEVELVQLDLSKIRDMGLAVSLAGGAATPRTTDAAGATVAFGGGTIAKIAEVLGSVNDFRRNVSFSIPTATYSLLKTIGNSELLANPELRISEGEKATLHIGQRIPVPVASFNSVAAGQPNSGTFAPVTSFQYQDVGIKVGMEPRVHHNREVTLKLTVEVSNLGEPVTVQGQPPQPTFATRTIESTIRLKDGETNFLAGLIQATKTEGNEKTPFLGDLPFIGRLFTKTRTEERRTDLVLTMTPHIIRIPDITDEDLAPMWVGTGTNLTFRGTSPRIESQGMVNDPFGRQTDVSTNANLPLSGGEPGNYVVPQGGTTSTDPNAAPPQGTTPNDPFRRPRPLPPAPAPAPNPNQPQPEPQASVRPSTNPATTPKLTAAATSAAMMEPDMAALRLAPRIAPQPATLILGPGETKVWNIVGMDVDALTVPELSFHFNPRAMDVTDISFGPALFADPASMPAIAIDRTAGTIRVTSTNGAPLKFVSGGVILAIRVHGGNPGDTFLVVDNPDVRTAGGASVIAAVAGGRARVQ